VSSTAPDPTSSGPARGRILAGLFGVVMFVIGLVVGNLALPHLLDAAEAGGSAAPPTVVAQLPVATPVLATPTQEPTPVPTPVPPTATPIPSTATPIPPTSTPTPIPPTATPLPPTATPTQVPTPTRGPSSVFAPEPTEPATSSPAAGTPPATGTASPTVTGTTTATSTATTTATISVTATGTRPTPTAPPFVATDRVDTELPVNFRAGPGTTFPTQGALPPGTLLAATGNAQTADGVLWREFRIANGTIGWIRAQDAAPV
jgi:outer membrane biosynthesis protein TonB